MRPVVSGSAEELFAAIAPISELDSDDTDWALLRLCDAPGRQLQDVEDLIRDTDAGPGWSSIVDVDRAPDTYLPWLAGLVGVRLVSGTAAGVQRDLIRAMPGFGRGTPGAIRAAIAPLLTGTQTISIMERDGGAYRLTVQTYTSETPDPAAVEAALIAAKPAGIILTYRVIAGVTIDELTGTIDAQTGTVDDYANRTS